jgi:histidine ammonia-lyase
MHKVLYILGQLSDQDVDWMLAVGHSSQLAPGTVLIREGEATDALYIVLQGTVSVSSRASGELSRAGRGEVLGEISFVDDQLPTATVRALDDVVVFALSREQLSAKLARDTGFAARFYRSLAVFLSDRMRKSNLARVAAASAGNISTYEESTPDAYEDTTPDQRGGERNIHLAASRLERLMTQMAASGDAVLISGNDLTIDDIARVAYQNAPVQITPLARERVEWSRQVVDKLVSSPILTYGLTTGLGALNGQRIDTEQLRQFQKNIVMSHAVGVRPEHSTEVVRAIMLARLNGMARGGAGVQPKVFELLAEMLNRAVHPIIPSRGSIGMSDLAPLAHMALPLIGKGEVEYQGRRLPSTVAFQLAGLEPVTLEAKDGLALCSANSASIGHGALVLRDAMDVLVCADIAAALSLVAFQGNITLLAEGIQAVRPHTGQLRCAERMRALLAGSGLFRGTSRPRNVQDPLSYRCVTQVHGACLDALSFVRSTIEIELNSTGDNPVVLPEYEMIVSNGNFHPAGLAMGFDTLGIVLGQLTSLSTSRTIKLMDSELSGLPPQLTRRPGINCGFGVIQKPLTALNAENRFLASPASLDFIPVANSIEDHATNATMTVNKASVMLENVRYVLAMELLSAAQAIDLREDASLGPAGRATYDAVRQAVPFMTDDDVLSTGIEAVHKLIASGDLLKAVSEASSDRLKD